MGFAYVFRSLSFLSWLRAWWQSDITVLEKKLRFLHEEQQITGREKHWTWLGASKSISSDISSSKITPTHLSFVEPRLKCQAFKCMSLLGPFFFKPSQHMNPFYIYKYSYTQYTHLLISIPY